MTDEDQEPDFPFFYTKLGELEFQVEGVEGETTEEVGEEFDDRIEELVGYALQLQSDDDTNGFQ